MNKSQITNTNLQTNLNTQYSKEKPYDLEVRTYEFTKEVIKFVRNIHRNIPNIEIIKQLIRSSGSVGANYIEANESLSKKDFTMRIKICRKEVKESRYWLKLLEIEKVKEIERLILIKESTELLKIFSKIIEKTK